MLVALPPLALSALILTLSSARAAPPAWLSPVTLSPEAQKSEQIAYATAETGDLHATIPAMASVLSDSTRSVVIRPAGSGKVTDVRVTPGQHVEKGQVLIVYTDHSLHELYLQRAQMQAALLSAQAAFQDATLSYRRGVALSGTTVSAGEVQRRLAVRQQAAATLAARQADLNLIHHRLTEEYTSASETIAHEEESRLVAPVSGVVQSITTAIAADVTAGEPVATVTDLSTIWIAAQLRPQEAAALTPGGDMHVRPAGDDSAPAVLSRISTIDGMADPATGLLRVISIVDNRAGTFRPGEMLDAQLETTRQRHGLIIPTSSLQDVDGHQVVYVPAGHDRFQPHEVHVLLETEERAVIDSDLPPGQRVVTQGSFALKGTALLGDAGGE